MNTEKNEENINKKIKKHKNKKDKKKLNIFSIFTRIFVIFIVVTVFAWGGLYAFQTYMELSATSPIDENGDPVEDIVSTTQKKGYIEALICGTNQSLTDTMIYVRYHLDTGKASMMSIPRDTYNNNKYCIGHKLNAIYLGKDIEPLIQEVESMLDVSIDYYAIFDTKAVREVVDALGGVEVNVPFDMEYEDSSQDLYIDLKKGVQILNGKQAEHFVRWRHNNDYTVQYQMADIDRTKTQQEFLKALIKTALQPQNILKANDVMNIGFKYVKTNATLKDALKYFDSALKIDINNITSLTMPGYATYIDQVSYYKGDVSEAQRIIKEQF